jgi:hypothetical protein
MHRRPLYGYGHMNLANGLVLVNDMTEMTDLGLISSASPNQK